MGSLLLFLQGLLVGFLASVPLGPIGVICVQRTLSGTHKSGFFSGIGAATADTIFAALAVFSLYMLGIVMAVLTGLMLKYTIMRGEATPFVMELPAYHWPTAGNVLRSMWERASSFMRKAGTIILLSSIFIWVGSVCGFVDGKFAFDPEMELENSILGIIGGAVSFVFRPLGFGTAKATIATVMGLVAKEEVVGECADLFYHVLVLLREKGVTLKEVCTELNERHKE